MTELLSELLAFRRLIAVSPVDMVHNPPPRPAGLAPVAILAMHLVEVVLRDGAPHIHHRASCPFVGSLIILGVQMARHSPQSQGVLAGRIPL